MVHEIRRSWRSFLFGVRFRIGLSWTPEPVVCPAQMDAAPKTELLAKTVMCGGMHTAALTEEVRWDVSCNVAPHFAKGGHSLSSDVKLAQLVQQQLNDPALFFPAQTSFFLYLVTMLCKTDDCSFGRGASLAAQVAWPVWQRVRCAQQRLSLRACSRRKSRLANSARRTWDRRRCHVRYAFG